MKAFRIIIIISLLLSMLSCQKENPIITPCDHSLPGLICKEYRYNKGDYTGYIQYGYNIEKQLVRQDLYSVNHTSVRYTFEYTLTGKLKQKSITNNEGNLIERFDYQYNEFDSLSKILDYKDEILQCLTTFEYNPNNFLFEKKSEYTDGSGAQYVYQYDGSKLYKESIFNLNGEIKNYSVYTYYSNQFTRICHFDADSQLTTYEIVHYTTDGKILEIKYYHADNKPLKKENWAYENGNLFKYSLFNPDNTLISYNMYQY